VAPWLLPVAMLADVQVLMLPQVSIVVASPSFAVVTVAVMCVTWLAVYEFWKKFDLDGRRHKLDQQALDMRARHEAGAGSRRGLAEATKKFRSGSDSEKLAGVKALLRRYQEEIDTLTRRARHAEKAFRDLFRPLVEAPDPCAALVAATDDSRRKRALQEEVERLRAEVKQYEAEFAALKNQDITIRQLEERLRLFESDVDRQVEAMTAQREQVLRAGLDEQLEAARVREAERDKAVAAAEGEVAEANRLADEAQVRPSRVAEGGRFANVFLLFCCLLFAVC